MPEEEQTNSKSEQEHHYETLIAAFKWLVGAMTILVAVAAWMLGSSLSDMKKDAAAQLDRFDKIIESMKAESEQANRDRSEEADKQMSNLRSNMETFLNFTKDVTSMQIAASREEAKNLALSSAKEEVEKTFRANNIQLVVDSAAKKEVGDRLNLIVDQEIQKTAEVFPRFAGLAILYERIGWGVRNALDALDSVANYSDNPSIRKAASSYLFQKGKDYEDFGSYDHTLISPNFSMPKVLDVLGIKDKQLYTSADTMRVRTAIEETILRDSDLSNVALAFITFRKLTGMNVSTFDIHFIRELVAGQR